MSQQIGLPLEFKLLLKGKVVGYESHIQTGFHNTFEIFQSKTGKDNDWWRAYSYLSIKQAIWIEHDEKRQWTGFKDKNGDKIYFGDKFINDYDNIFTVMIYEGKIFGKNKEFYILPDIWPQKFKEMELIDG